MLKKLLYALWLVVRKVYKAVSWVVFTIFAFIGLAFVSIALYFNTHTSVLTASVDQKFTGEKYLYLNLEDVTEKSAALPGFYNLAINLGLNVPSQVSVTDVVEVLERAAKDDRIKGLIFDVEKADLETWGIAEEIGRAIDKFKKDSDGKKPVVAYSQYYSTSELLMFKNVDTLLVDRQGEFGDDWTASSLFLKDFYQNYGIKNYSVVYGKYALANLSAQSGFTEDNLVSIKSIVSTPAKYFYEEINKARTVKHPDHQLNLNYDKDFTLQKRIDDELTLRYTSDLFADRGLFDKVVSRLQFSDYVRDLAGVEDKTKYPKVVTLGEYLEDKRAAESEDKADNSKKDYYLNYYYGGIFGQKAADINVHDLIDELYSVTINKRPAKSTDAGKGQLKGIVLRIDSLGGVAGDSKILHDGLRKISESGTPVVVVTGDGLIGAAYVGATGADAIVASRYVPVGGVSTSSEILDVTDTLRAFYNINPSYFRGSQLVSPGGRIPFPFNLLVSGDVSLVSPQFVEYRNIVTKGGYDELVKLVSVGRKLGENASSVTDGRIYTGQEAYDVKLVDALGGVDEAYKILDDLNTKKDESFKADAIIKYEANPEEAPYSSLLSTLNAEFSAYQDYKARQELGLSESSYKVLKFKLANSSEVLSLCETCFTPTSRNTPATFNSKLSMGNTYLNEALLRLSRAR